MTSFLTPISTNLNLVIDTNQFISVFVFRGKMMKLVFELIIDRKINLYISSALKDELLRKLQEFKVVEGIQSEVLDFIETKGVLVEPSVKVTACRDKEDNFLLELAETAKADYLITRDKDLLDLPKHIWKTTIIIKPEDFLPLLRSLKIIE